MNIFKGNILDKQYINTKNYCSLSGFTVQVFGDSVEEKKLRTIVSDICFFSDGTIAALQNVTIPKFDRNDIPPGEFIWMRERRGRWTLRRAGRMNGNSNSFGPALVVPLLIASTPKEAEQMMRWAKRD